jgi:hypothetical protein
MNPNRDSFFIFYEGRCKSHLAPAIVGRDPSVAGSGEIFLQNQSIVKVYFYMLKIIFAKNHYPCLFSYVNQVLVLKIHHLLDYLRPSAVIFNFIIIAFSRIINMQ